MTHERTRLSYCSLVLQPGLICPRKLAGVIPETRDHGSKLLT